ncbi:MAG: hypothetical protein M1294_14725 [Firmicutes bacterium]|jgi:hypothetical protein|uniref:Uncharacterized protein n=1 Tax=Sulfobacillus benefaciens TaxID=453960 RepID=A0A2T2WV94_9FIRM|nr:hypothetical protein [Bacillota bacterium]MCL5014862.1 hypothetical protein [Bacillota bacterium]PSR26143.1 MAG: hypothetical protein C7B43_14755 [Sulfobacillus benefaciens]HBQ94064.1 hypothetical protein [Sulfobacillus sp.]
MSPEPVSLEHETHISVGTVEQLESFITRPDTRQGDIFIEQNFPVGPELTLNWIVKHDIFEGVVMHVSLIDTDSYRHLGGVDKTISDAHDIFGEYTVRHQSKTYRLLIKPEQNA